MGDEAGGGALVSGVLVADALSVRYGGLDALTGVSFTLTQGESVGLIGSNGSGKSTLVDVLSGIVIPHAGRVHLHGDDVTRLSAARRTRRGIARTFQRVASFRGLTVAEHRAVALAGAFRPRQILARSAEVLLREAGVDVDSAVPAEALPAAVRRLLDVARALWTGPEVLVLDEPFAGLDEAQSAALLRCLHACRDHDLTLLLVEHRFTELFAVADRLLVLGSGRLIADGVPDEVVERDDVVRSYQGFVIPAGP